MGIKLTREEFRRIKAMSREQMEEFIDHLTGMEEETLEAARRSALKESREAMEKAMEIKGVGPKRKAEMRKKYKEVLHGERIARGSERGNGSLPVLRPDPHVCQCVHESGVVE